MVTKKLAALVALLSLTSVVTAGDNQGHSGGSGQENSTDDFFHGFSGLGHENDDSNGQCKQGPQGPQGPAGGEGPAGPVGPPGPPSLGSYLSIAAPVVLNGSHRPGEFNFSNPLQVTSSGTDITLSFDTSADGHIVINTTGSYQVTYALTPQDNNPGTLNPDSCRVELTVNDGSTSKAGAATYFKGVGDSKGNFSYSTSGVSVILNLNQADRLQIAPVSPQTVCVANEVEKSLHIGSISVLRLK